MSSPSQLQDAMAKLSSDAVKRFISTDVKVVGLGSGSTAAFIVREMAKLKNKSIEFIPTSLQIKLEAEKGGLRIADENRIPEIDVVFDGADQIDSHFNMIKGGGGALLREKILISSAKNVIIVADASKFVDRFNRSVPIEVHPFARTAVLRKLTEVGGRPVLRIIEKGYPFVSENGNFIFDTTFGSIPDAKKKEMEIKNIAGVVEVGLFTRKADAYYKAKNDGSFEIVHPK